MRTRHCIGVCIGNSAGWHRCRPSPQQSQSKLDRVVVTATRMPEDINTTMRDISVLDGTSLRAAGIVDIADALRLLPALNLQRLVREPPVDFFCVGPAATRRCC